MRMYRVASICSFLFFGTLIMFAFTTIRHPKQDYPVYQSVRLDKMNNSSGVMNKSMSNPNVLRKRENIFFLKTHKCGSSTVQNILFRYGKENNLLFLLPSEKQANYIGNPRLFNRKLIDKSVRTVDNTYNIFTHHTRYNPTEVKTVMKPNSAFVTILRDPATLFESMFVFYKFSRKYNITFDEFMKDTKKFEDIMLRRGVTRYGANQMCFDLGLDEHKFNDDGYLYESLKSFELDFALVMISEHMEASLVLLADLMGWSLEQVRFFDINKRQSSRKENLTEEAKQELRNFNRADTKLYNYFSEIFKSKIKAYGLSKMKKQVRKLISMNYEMLDICVANENYKGYGRTHSYTLKQGAPPECSLFSEVEISFTRKLRVEHIQKLKKLQNLQSFMDSEYEVSHTNGYGSNQTR